jgi:hypothetical protein
MKEADNRVVKYGLYCLNAFLACLECFVKFVTEQSYIRIALCGDNFMTSCRWVFWNSFNNALDIGMVAGMGGILVKIGEFTVAIISTVAGYYYINS